MVTDEFCAAMLAAFGERRQLLQLAEEATELSLAAQKLVRALEHPDSDRSGLAVVDAVYALSGELADTEQCIGQAWRALGPYFATGRHDLTRAKLLEKTVTKAAHYGIGRLEQMASGLVVFEGPDGAGKSTMIKSIRGVIGEVIGADGCSRVAFTREPYGQKLYDRSQGVTPPQELFCQDRDRHVEAVIRPALERHEIVVTDRYWPSTIAYGSGAIEEEVKAYLERWPKPSVVIYMDPFCPTVCPVQAPPWLVERYGDTIQAIERAGAKVVRATADSNPALLLLEILRILHEVGDLC